MWRRKGGISLPRERVEQPGERLHENLEFEVGVVKKEQLRERPIEAGA